MPTSIKRSFFCVVLWVGTPKRPLLTRFSAVLGAGVDVVVVTGVGAAVAVGALVVTVVVVVDRSVEVVSVAVTLSALGGIRFFSDSSRLLR